MGYPESGLKLVLMVRSLHSSEYQAFRFAIAEAREKADLTQADLAKRLGKPQSFVSKYENGERRLDVIEFLTVCHAIKVDPLSFLKQFIQALQCEHKRYSRQGKRTP